MYLLPALSPDAIPVIETDRFRLRANTLDDFQPMFDMWQTPAFYEHIGGKPRPSGYLWSQLQKNIGSWALFGFGYWTIADLETDRFIGECGFTLSKRSEINPPLKNIPEAGWGIHPDYWGKGYTKAAMSAALDWALSQDPDFPCQCIINEGHRASEAVARSLGMTIVRTVAFDGDEDEPVNVWENVTAARAS
ncbi:GNAT family N-acetyltransferase [Ponticaulis sp.]|uniref:GNAT family N-acetyltransferase n=1 Tax=Ponticaulis sp. TaxID=2020902 RepID=UPI0025D4BCF6|nr:GNAT family N-acetyltransferase [Ponticaulis sp.]|tara:strand:- start:7892 stop:8467 length:576 start_codon:yes stop_codon:yes gene_type:complete